MLRLFSEHNLRLTELLSGAWQFHTDPQDVGLREGWQNTLPQDSSTVILPSCWNNEFGLYTYEGVCWYSRTVTVRQPNFRLVFEAVMTDAVVYWDGVEITRHYGGFTAFSVVLRSQTPGPHTLTLRVDNSFDADSIPQTRVDWYHYGGVPRDIEAEYLSGICIMEQYVTYTLSDNRSAVLTCHARLESFADCPVEDTLQLNISGAEPVLLPLSLSPAESREVTLTVTLPSVSLWEPEAPVLYPLTLSTSTDDLIDRIGFRTVTIRDRQILLNGKPLYFRGVCRHEENPDFGFAFPRRLMKRDIDILKDLNCNAVRGSHYPNSQSFIDYLDETGILFWSEIPVWGCGFSEEALGRQKVLERGLQMHREMIAQYRNHPSIVLWGLHNEILTHTENARRMTELFYREVKQLDDSRPVTYATCYPLKDTCTDFCDVLGVNCYIGWYQGDMSGWDGYPERVRDYLTTQGAAEKPVLMSEFGGAALYGYHTFDGVKWTEEYQEALLRKALTVFAESREVCGSYIWQFCDIRTAPEEGIERARGFNNKGILNEYRKPKLAYGTVKEIYGKLAAQNQNT